MISQIQSAILAPRCPPPLEPSPPLWRLQPARLLPIDGVAHFAFAVGAFFLSFPVCLACVCGHGMWLCFWLSLSLYRSCFHAPIYLCPRPCFAARCSAYISLSMLPDISLPVNSTSHLPRLRERRSKTRVIQQHLLESLIVLAVPCWPTHHLRVCVNASMCARIEHRNQDGCISRLSADPWRPKLGVCVCGEGSACLFTHTNIHTHACACGWTNVKTEPLCTHTHLISLRRQRPVARPS